MKPKQPLSFLIILLSAFFFFAGCSKNDSGTGLPSINTANDKITGSSGRDLLSSGSFTTLNIEIQYMTGFAPDGPSLYNLTSFLNSSINKPGGISISQKEIPTGNKASYTLNDIASIEQKNRTAFNSGNQLAVYVLITDGAYSDPSVLGVAYRNTSLCLLGKTIFDNSGLVVGQVTRTKLESTVIEHEFGHLLGLVNTGTPMVTNHNDKAHNHHCTVKTCLMYYATETSDIFGMLVTDDIPQLDSQCLMDLHANGGK
jgi:hypothetical protein